MAEGDSPTIARLRVRIAIREAREAAGLTQAQVAEAMEWSNSKIIRIENGENTISINDLRSLLSLLHVNDKALVGSLLADARTARLRVRAKRVWWGQPRFREHLSEPLRRFIEYEAEASEIRLFTVLYVPGLLQTPEYGRALTGMWSDEMSGPKIDALVDARRHRHELLLDRLGTVKIMVVADESIFRRVVGGSEIFVEQLRHLVNLSERGLTKIRMLPLNDLPVAIANNGSFDLMTVGADRAEREIMYRENGILDEVVENRADNARHRKRFEQLWQAADDEDDTIDFIKGRIAALEANLPARHE
ncbi:helix-turn-helix transcriptional regulator [Actinoplanes bogorensis]|uniref:Helix-turn-helix transcriptional regulator n=1 Tax=Paractinoplanes bogorensis TaxID=1610840 RepID=A0ABS5YW23_9ACTN|nr:helix-turn-helix transcriptional regulator [Actinoplanes bogorensis]MBU2667648.1 helix-turn-helix transcriptional regulator [Actinoplanes bogorensis]